MRSFFLFAFLLSSNWVTRAQNLAVVDAEVYSSPTASPFDNVTIVIRTGKIVTVGKHRFRSHRGEELHEPDFVELVRVNASESD